MSWGLLPTTFPSLSPLPAPNTECKKYNGNKIKEGKRRVNDPHNTFHTLVAYVKGRCQNDGAIIIIIIIIIMMMMMMMMNK